MTAGRSAPRVPPCARARAPPWQTPAAGASAAGGVCECRRSPLGGVLGAPPPRRRPYATLPWLARRHGVAFPPHGRCATTPGRQGGAPKNPTHHPRPPGGAGPPTPTPTPTPTSRVVGGFARAKGGCAEHVCLGADALCEPARRLGGAPLRRRARARRFRPRADARREGALHLPDRPPDFRFRARPLRRRPRRRRRRHGAAGRRHRVAGGGCERPRAAAAARQRPVGDGGGAEGDGGEGGADGGGAAAAVAQRVGRRAGAVGGGADDLCLRARGGGGGAGGFGLGAGAFGGAAGGFRAGADERGKGAADLRAAPLHLLHGARELVEEGGGGGDAAAAAAVDGATAVTSARRKRRRAGRARRPPAMRRRGVAAGRGWRLATVAAVPADPAGGGARPTGGAPADVSAEWSQSAAPDQLVRLPPSQRTPAVQGPCRCGGAARAEPTAKVGQRRAPRISNEATFRREVPTRGGHEKSPAHVVQRQAPPTAAVRRPPPPPPHRAAYRPWARHEAWRSAHARPASSAVWAVAHQSRQRLVCKRGATGEEGCSGAPAPRRWRGPASTLHPAGERTARPPTPHPHPPLTLAPGGAGGLQRGVRLYATRESRQHAAARSAARARAAG
ncbi:hypothetical protein BU14_0099s0018 [Porphyra umbilicalis]|uniref:Uncharacterized protein n=1 Tax=Porphyra umbilicalis TaxID=2786 RepID=A0A1X6PDQ0_PORUM|nr:hypothetical protein BU14_0099s0018 [Porphyra umbilicalis]|eukprot:OSX78753.1 hypothetical protein BU14_0099s0018 [Porphyra umbilicalis]